MQYSVGKYRVGINWVVRPPTEKTDYIVSDEARISSYKKRTYKRLA
jgi:hypothetical protein